MILLDTNVLVYAATDAPLSPVASDLVARAGVLPLATTARIVEEFAHVYARRSRTRDDAHERVAEITEMLGPLLFTADETLAAALDLWAGHPSLDLTDALLAATAIDLGAALVSADKAFGDVAGLQFVDLAAPDLSERLGAN